MANAFLEALKRQKLQQMSHQPQPLPPDLLGAMARAEGNLYDKSLIYKSLKDAFTAPKRAYEGEFDPMSPYGVQEAMNLAGMAQVGGMPGGARGPGSVGMTVYHGSPHKFDKFDMSKIGTGEGAQHYGHGLYFAETPDVARTYGRSTTPGSRAFNSIKYNGQDLPAGSRDGELLYDITTKGRAEVIRNLQKQADRLETINPKESANLLNRIAYAKTVNPDNVQIDAGNLYKVDIPDESIPRMLDFDKPMSQQSPEVVNVFKKFLGDTQMRPDDAWEMLKGSTGGEAYFKVGGRNADSTSSMLKELGIPGIRYLDGGSRGAGEGTSNYVLFDDQMPRILEINGQPTGLKPWADDVRRPTNAQGQPIPPTRYELEHAEAQRVAALPVEQGGLGLPANNTAMDRARAMGGIPAYHGTASDINQIDPSMFGSSTGAQSAKRAWWAVDEPSTARGYAEYAANQAPVKRVLDEAYRLEKKGDFDGYDAMLGKAEQLETDFAANPLNGQNIMPLMIMPKNPKTMNAMGAEFTDVEGGINNFLRQAKYGGNDVAVIENLADDVGFNGRPATHYGVLNPSSIRSRFAAFNPAKRDSADLLASFGAPVASSALLAYLLGGSDDAEAGNLYDYLSRE